MGNEKLNLVEGFNTVVTYYEKYTLPNSVKLTSFKDLYTTFDFIYQFDIQVISVYYAVCDKDGNILRGMHVPYRIKHNEYYEYKKKFIGDSSG